MSDVMNIFRFIPRKCRRLFVACVFTTATTLIFIKLGTEVQIHRDLYTGSLFVQVINFYVCAPRNACGINKVRYLYCIVDTPMTTGASQQVAHSWLPIHSSLQ